MPDLATVFAEDVPIFRGRMANAAGNKAVQFESHMRRPSMKSHRPTPAEPV
jgi:flagellar motor switch protein FliM